MAFDFGAALQSAGQISPAVHAARQQEVEERRSAAAFQQKQRADALQNRYKEAEIGKMEQDKQKWVPVRSYKTQTGEEHSIYLTPSGYQDVVDSPGRPTYAATMAEAATVFGGPDKVPEWFKNQALATSTGMPYKPQATHYSWGQPIPDKSSPTGYVQESRDQSGELYATREAEPPRGLVPTKTESSRVDPATGLTTRTSTTRTPLVPGGGPISATSPLPPQLTGQTPLRGRDRAREAAAGAPATGKYELDSSGHIPPTKGYTEIVRSTANAIIDAGDEKQVQAPAAVKALARDLVQKYKGSSPSLATGARKVIQTIEPTIAQTDKLMADIDRLGLKDNNTPGYLALERAKYGAGIASPAGTLGADIAGLSLGSVVEATSALSGGSRAMPALRIALQHTPNAWVDSPKMMYEKLKTINDRLKDMDEEARTGKLDALQSQPGAAPEGTRVQMQDGSFQVKRGGKWEKE